jgi:hypothetical protein
VFCWQWHSRCQLFAGISFFGASDLLAGVVSGASHSLARSTGAGLAGETLASGVLATAGKCWPPWLLAAGLWLAVWVLAIGFRASKTLVKP